MQQRLWPFRTMSETSVLLYVLVCPVTLLTAAAQVAADYLSAVHSAASLSAACSAQQTNEQGAAVPQRQLRGDWEKLLQQGMELAEGPASDHFLRVDDLSSASWLASESQVSLHHHWMQTQKNFQVPCQVCNNLRVRKAGSCYRVNVDHWCTQICVHQAW